MYSFNDLFKKATAADYEQLILDAGQRMLLRTTAWQPGSITRTIVKIMASILSLRDDIDSQFAAAGYLDTASDPLISPEPVSGVLFTGSWLDLLTESVYDVSRLTATYGSGTFKFTNTSATPHTYTAGTFHAVIDNSYTYTNTEAFTIPANGTVTAVPFQADVIGFVGSTTYPSNYTVVSVTPVIGVTIKTDYPITVRDYETNAQLVERCKNKLSALSPGGASGCYEYFATTIPTEDPPQVASGLRTTPISPCNRLSIYNYSPGVIDGYAANAAGAYTSNQCWTNNTEKTINIVSSSGSANLIVINCTTPHGYSTGDSVYITGVSGTVGPAVNCAADGYDSWVVEYYSTYSVKLTGSQFSGVYSGGGTMIRISDLDLVQRNLEAYCVPFSVTMRLHPAINQPITIVYDLYINSLFASQDLITNINASITNYVNSFPIGGGTGDINYISYDRIVSLIMNQDSHIQEVDLTLDGGTSDIYLSTSYRCATAVITPSVFPDTHIHNI
jgi:hypothetical protein